MSDKDEKKGGFFKRAFGLKSKDEKLAEEAAARAEAQQRVDAEMAARMAAINAAALKSAREQDAKSLGVAPETGTDAQDLEDQRKAEEQARKDVEAAKRLAAEKRAKALEAERVAKEEEAFKKAEVARERELQRKAEIESARLAKEKAEADARREKAAKAALEKARREQGEREAAALKAKQDADEVARREAEILAAKAAKDAQLKAEAEAKAARDAELEARRKRAAEQAAKDAAEAERVRAERDREDQRIAEALAAQRAAEAEARLNNEGGFLERVNEGLKKSTSRMSENMAALFTQRKLDDAALQDLEDLLVGADMGVGPAMKVSAKLAEDRFEKDVTDTEIKIALADVISDILTPLEKPLILTDARPQVLLFVGVNGSGKTTTLGKIARRIRDEGKRVLIVAGDTFRAAAVEQLSVWGERADAPVMSGTLGADAAGLVFDAIARARAEEFDVVMIDTAGRLQNRTELMEELGKIVRVIKKQDATAPHHTILVLDATVGQNALSQTEAFKDTAGVTGLIMTKLDGTAKGGVLVALSDKFKLPIHAIGIGERLEDLENFSAPVFAAALSGVADEMLAGGKLENEGLEDKTLGEENPKS